MTRTYLAALTATVSVAFVAVVSATGCQSSGVGDPCTPEAEYAPSFMGFDESEVNVESKSFQCLTRLCLVNHFRGRVSCPYGQNAGATMADQASAPTGFQCDGKSASNSPDTQCCLPGVDTPVISAADCPSGNCTTVPAGTSHSEVQPNCTDRTADKAVYCSCRCANAEGKTDDGANYCACPSGFSCTQLVAPIGVGNSGLTGAYCVKDKTAYNKATACSSTCDPTAKSGSLGYCGPTNNAQN